MQTIDVTPSWLGILPALLTLAQSERLETRQLAIQELERMAVLADRFATIRQAEMSAGTL